MTKLKTPDCLEANKEPGEPYVMAKQALEGDNGGSTRASNDSGEDAITSIQTKINGASEDPIIDTDTETDANGNIARFKTPPIVNDYNQQGVDLDEVHAPNRKHTTLSALLEITASDDLELHAMDIKTAFLNGELEETFYTQQPIGCSDGIMEAYHLERTPYGLQQAPSTWHHRLKMELKSIGFIQSDADPGFFYTDYKTERVYLVTYVDDLLIAAKTLEAVNNLKSKLMDIFNMRDLGEATEYLGMTIARDRTRHTIKLAQETMTMELLKNYNMENAKTTAIPLAESTKLNKDGTPLDTAVYPYRTLIGRLLYLSVCTRPDIAYSVGALSKYVSTPTEEHWKAAKGVLRYLGGTRTYGINFGGDRRNILPQGYCDADYTGDTDTRRSTTGYVFSMAGGAITWASRRQPTVAASTTEAEYMAASHATKEALWLRKLLTGFGLPGATILIRADNQGAI
jgi:hypothetical protein